MKKIACFIVGLSIMLLSKPGFGFGENDNQNSDQPVGKSEQTVTVTCSDELKSIVTVWAANFEKQNPAVNVSISGFDGKQFTSSGVVSLVNEKDAEKVSNETGWKILVAKDVIVAVFNKNNPLNEEILRQGITSAEFALILQSEQNQNWANLINEKNNIPFNYYITDNDFVKNGVVDFANTRTNFENANIVTAAELVSSVEKDINAIGICRLIDVVDADKGNIVGSLSILPIDKNKNDRIDSFENIYESVSSVSRGVWTGKYPSMLCGSIYAVSATKPVGHEIDFLHWLNTSGQQLMAEIGLCAISSIEKENNLLALTITETATMPEKKTSNASVWVIIFALVAIAGFITTAVVRSIRKAAGAADFDVPEIKAMLNENSVEAPKGIYYDRTHTWAFMEKDGNVRVGIDDFLQHITGALTRVKMKAVGEKIRRGEKILTLNQNGKQLEIYSPVTGVIKDYNKSLLTDTARINTAPYTEGWVYSVEPMNWLREIQLMFMSDKYKEWLRNEFARLRDFFAITVRSNDAAYAHIVLQDGGELTDKVLEDLGPEVWEQFQEKFINSSK